MKKTILILIASAALLAGCIQDNSDDTDRDKQEVLIRQGQAQAGMPAIHNFTEKKMVKMLYELRDNPNLINYAYLWSEVSGKWVYFGKCIGYGIPYSTQYSNPEKEYYSTLALLQAEPNGLFMPASSDGTWLMIINPENSADIKPVYVEPKVIVSPFKLN